MQPPPARPPAEPPGPGQTAAQPPVASDEDAHRPRWHFSPRHWMNDPIPFFWDGTYHVFFQHNPNGAFWGTMHWGHAVSRDLLHWEELPIALAPTPGGPDADGVFTGCVFHAGPDGPGGPAAPFCALYTGIPSLGPPLVQVQCLAVSPDLMRWEKPAANPVIGAPPPGVALGPCFRDPCVWREGDAWWMTVGSEQPERKGGLALLYRSADLLHWDVRGVMAEGRTAETGFDFECPDFFPLEQAPGAPGTPGTPGTSSETRHVLLTSRGRSWWRTGAYARERFTAERWGPLDGEPYYAAKSLLDGQGRRILFGWLREGRPREAQLAAGWSGVLALPRQLTLTSGSALSGLDLVQSPVPEVNSLRGPHHHFPAQTLAPGSDVPLPDVSGDSLEIALHCVPEPGAVYGLRVRRTPDGAEGTEVAIDTAAGTLGDVPLRPAPGSPARGPSENPRGAPVILRVFVDRSVVEAFAGGACLTQRTYPTRPDALGVSLFARGAPVRVEGVDVWEIAP